MARFLLRLPDRNFARYVKQDLHIVPKGSWHRLTAEERLFAKRKGIVFRADDYQTHTGKPIDELPIEDLTEPRPSAAEELAEEQPAEEVGEHKAHIAELCADERTWYVVRQVLDVIISSPNARLEAECFRISSGLGMLDDITEASVARKHGLTRAAVSKRCVRQTKLLGIKPSQYMRSLQLRETYKKARIKSLNKGASKK